MSEETYTMKKSSLTDWDIEKIFQERKNGGRIFRLQSERKTKIKFSEEAIEIKEIEHLEENVSNGTSEYIEKADQSEDTGGEETN